MTAKRIPLSSNDLKRNNASMRANMNCHNSSKDMFTTEASTIKNQSVQHASCHRRLFPESYELVQFYPELHHRRACNRIFSVGTLQMCTLVFFGILLSMVARIQATSTATTPKYSQLLSTNGQMEEMSTGDAEDTFRPFIPKDPAAIARTVFTPTGQFRVFQTVDTDLRSTVNLARNSQANQIISPPHSTLSTAPIDKNTLQGNSTENIHENNKTQTLAKAKQISGNDIDNKLNTIPDSNGDLSTDLRSLEDLLVEYVQNFFEKGEYQPLPGLLVELQKNHTPSAESSLQQKSRHTRHTAPTGAKISLDMPRTLATGRVLFLTGLKKLLWPVFMGLQVLKSLLIAMFIPAIIGSFTKLLGKGLSQGSAPLFIRPMDPPQELDFRDNFGDGDKFVAGEDGLTDFMPSEDNKPYAYNQPEASQYSNQYTLNSVSPTSQLGPLSFTRLGMNERQHQLMQDSYAGALQSITSASFKNSNSISGGSSSLSAPMVNKPAAPANMNNFQQFQKVPASSLLLSNYDPFYSPLLSRLDSVFGQLKLNSDNEECREKVICLMYANPAKYAPYSNLVSAQLSRELNELRKPTSDNPDILRFFKYMRAAKDGQDGIDCEKTFDKCTEFKDFENPAMVSTYHDINKLVQARKMA
uniref:Uncharacterized protein n=1 Tax=Stomoxys calcitrans TaxID=35570 RepID=A0A1I8NXQ3_STOCA